MTSHYQIITHWINSCENELQLDTVLKFIMEHLITDEKTKDDLIAYWKDNHKQRAWVAAKVAQRDYVDVSNTSLLACDEYHDEQPSDNV